MKQCLSILLACCILAPFSFAGDTTASPTPAAPVATPAVAVAAQDKPRVFVTDEPINQSDTIARGNGSVGHSESGANPVVVQIQADLIKLCPKVTVTNRPETADFTLLFRRQNGKRSAMFAFGGLAGLAISATFKVDGASLFSAKGDLIMATKARTAENAIRDVCAAIPTTVAHDAAPPVPAQAADSEPPAPAPEPALPAQPASVQPGAEMLIGSTPNGADIEVDGGFVGNTPSSIETSVGDHVVVIRKKGFKDWERKVKVSGGSISLSAELDPAS